MSFDVNWSGVEKDEADVYHHLKVRRSKTMEVEEEIATALTAEDCLINQSIPFHNPFTMSEFDPDTATTGKKHREIAKFRSEMNQAEFCWQFYLQEVNAYAVPHIAFDHVTKSLKSGLEEGQFLEYVYPTESGRKAFWYIELLHARQPEMLVRYFGLHEYPETAFWLDLRTAEVYPFGGCDKTVYTRRPPKLVCQHRGYLGPEIEKARRGLPSPSAKDLLGPGVAFKDHFRVGSSLEVIDDQRPNTIWPAVVVENVGGRLRIEQHWYSQVSDCSDTVAFWTFCTDSRLQAVGRGLSGGFEYAPPTGLVVTEDNEEELTTYRENSKNIDCVENVFPPFTVKSTPFLKDYYIELLHPVHRREVVPAFISDVFADGTMLVEVLDLRPAGKYDRIVRLRHSSSLDVLPVQWAAKHGLRLYCPGLEGEFEWKSFIQERGGKVAPEKWFPHLIPLTNPSYLNRFQRGMKLEVSNPSEPGEICLATIVRVLPPLLSVNMDQHTGPRATHCLTFHSMEMFPLGFCNSHSYPMPVPPVPMSDRYLPGLSGNPFNSGSALVYVNPGCNCGPWINPRKLARRPKWIGPGPIQLVLENVVACLIGCGVAQAKMLQVISSAGPAASSDNWHRVKIALKIGGRRVVSQLDMVKDACQVADFLRSVCLKYDTCPNLLTTQPVIGACPGRCHQFVKPERKVKRGRWPQKPPPDRHTPPQGDTGYQADADEDHFASSAAQIPAIEDDSSPDDEQSSVCSGEPSRKKSRSAEDRFRCESTPFNTVRLSRSSSPEAPIESPSPGQRHENQVMTMAMSPGSDTENRPVDGRLVDDSQHLLHFFRDPNTWTVQEVHDFLQSYLPKSSRVPDVLKQEGVDGEALLMMVAPDLQHLKLGEIDTTEFGEVLERILLSLCFSGNKVSLCGKKK